MIYWPPPSILWLISFNHPIPAQCMRLGMGCSPSADGSQSLMSPHIYTGLSNSPQFADERLEIESTSKIGTSSLHTKDCFTIHYPSLIYHHSPFILTVASILLITAKMIASSFVAWPPSIYPYIKYTRLLAQLPKFFFTKKKKKRFIFFWKRLCW